MSITITEVAAERIKSYGGNSVRFGVEASGCTGMEYNISLDIGEEHNNDYLYESNGITIVVNHKSIPFVDGTEIDYDDAPLSGGFQYNNPNVKNMCGCGISFTTGE